MNRFRLAAILWPHVANVIVLLLFLFSQCFLHAALNPPEIVTAARKQIGVTVSYDPSYRKLEFPGGDVPKEAGVCTDVVIRALRQQGLDLQKEVHEDMRSNFSAYPQKWGLKKPDPNIDHRRVPNLVTYFKRQGYGQKVSDKPETYLPGDIVTWVLDGGLTHIGIVSDHKTSTGTPLIIHNIGSGTQEEDILFRFNITGHFRLK
jgi:uncharacterized protein